MYQGKFSTEGAKPRKKSRRLRWSKPFAVLCAVAVLLVGLIGGSLAYLVDQKEVVNNFEYAYVTCQVNDDHTVTNTSNIPAYIRATVAVSWVKDENGAKVVYPGTPSFTVSSDGWTEVGGFYYYNQTVDTQGKTGALNVSTKAPEGYEAVIEILADAIQSEPAQAAKDAWGYVPGAGN